MYKIIISFLLFLTPLLFSQEKTLSSYKVDEFEIINNKDTTVFENNNLVLIDSDSLKVINNKKNYSFNITNGITGISFHYGNPVKTAAIAFGIGAIAGFCLPQLFGSEFKIAQSLTGAAVLGTIIGGIGLLLGATASHDEEYDLTQIQADRKRESLKKIFIENRK